ncbi:MAG TPA: response regulator [Blastocatellia bacterium]|nr:response regulator [Blastocatellia bacterium]
MQLPKDRILLVEDNNDTQTMLVFLLGDAGYEVAPAGTCAEAFQLAESELFDLYMIDGLLPDGTGLDLCRKLHHYNPRMPIVFHSALTYETDKQQAYAAGAQDYLAKPADMDEISATIARLLNRKTMQAI